MVRYGKRSNFGDLKQTETITKDLKSTKKCNEIIIKNRMNRCN